jgi:F-type H+-transporting ATPase subunit delta
MALDSSVSRRYATALVEAAAAASTLETVAAHLEAFSGAFESDAELSGALTSPVFTVAQRREMLGKVLDSIQVEPLLRRFLDLLAERDRLDEVPAVSRAVRKMADARAGRMRARVEAAAPLTEDAAESLRRALEKRTGKKIEMEIVVDPSLLGGVRASIGSTVLDGTLRSQLERLRDSLARAD